MAFSFGTWNPQPWNGKIPTKMKAESAILAIVSAGGRMDVMKSREEVGPLWADFTVKAYGKLEALVWQDPSADEVTLRARKIEGGAKIAEEDLAEGKNYNFDIVQNLRDRGVTNTAVYFDNASIGTSGDATTGESNILRPYRSIYTAVRVDAAANYSTVAAAATTAQLRTALKSNVETAERSDYADDIVTVADPIWKSYLRDLPVDGSNGAPIWDPVADTVYGNKIYWSKGARLANASGAGTATHAPSGNALWVTGPRQLFITGRAPFTTGNPAVPEAYLSDPKTGVGMENDSAWFKLRSYLAFTPGISAAFTVLERTP